MEGFGFWGFNTAEYRREIRFPHEFQKLGALGNIEGGFTGKLKGIATLLLPFNQLRQKVCHRSAIANKIVIDKIH